MWQLILYIEGDLPYYMLVIVCVIQQLILVLNF